jgi:hypothetical protein
VLQPPPALGCGTFVSGDVPRSPLAGQGDVLDGVMIKHATAGTFVFCRFPDEWRLGLIEHPRLNVLACPGGHVERDESADAAAIRETEEETGLRGIRLLEFPAPGLPEGFPLPTRDCRCPGGRLRSRFLLIITCPPGTFISTMCGRRSPALQYPRAGRRIRSGGTQRQKWPAGCPCSRTPGYWHRCCSMLSANSLSAVASRRT